MVQWLLCFLLSVCLEAFSILTPAHNQPAGSLSSGKTEHLSAYVNVSFLGVRSTALCPALSHPGKTPSLCTWGRVFCSRIVSSGLKMFFCHLEPRFMAKGMDVWITDSGSLSPSWERGCKSAKNCLQWKECKRHPELVFSSWWILVFEGKMDLNLLWLWEGVQAV